MQKEYDLSGKLPGYRAWSGYFLSLRYKLQVMMRTILLFTAALLTAAPLIARGPVHPGGYRVGEYEVYVLVENEGRGNTGILIDAPETVLKEYAPEGTFPNAVNAVLIKGRDKVWIVDTGFGRHIFGQMAALGVAPEDVDVVLLTHMHGDHIGGLLKDEKVTFPNATMYLGQIEHDYWAKGDHTSQQKVINAYKNKLKLFTPNEITNNETSLLPGIYGIVAYGHTPGHTAFMLESENQQFLVWGDLTHAMKIQMPCPQVAVTYDVDPNLAIKSRKKILEFVSKKNIPIAGMHIAHPGMGTVKSNHNNGYEFIPYTN